MLITFCIVLWRLLSASVSTVSLSLGSLSQTAVYDVLIKEIRLLQVAVIDHNLCAFIRIMYFAPV